MILKTTAPIDLLDIRMPKFVKTFNSLKHAISMMHNKVKHHKRRYFYILRNGVLFSLKKKE